MTFFAFLGALSLSVLAFELMSVFQTAFSTFGGNRLMNFQSPHSNQETFDLGGVAGCHPARTL